MIVYLQRLVKLRIYLLVIASISFYGSLHADGLRYDYYPRGVVPLFEPTYLGLQRYFADSTLFKISYSRFTREVSLDSTKNYVLIEESFFDTHYRLPIKVDLDYYIRERMQFENRRIWVESLHKVKQLTEAGGGGGIELNIPVKIKSKAFKRIFGGDRVGLRVTGNITFELAGRSESREGSAVSSIEEQGNFTPKFKQTQQFRVEGRVGDKVTVSVDQNSEATFDFENTLKLTYDGDEDEIVQKIEAGNVNLSLPSTNYVSTGSNHQGLFGLKTEMRVGNFNFTGIASLERGENQSLSITGGSREQSFRVKDYDYVRDRFFFIDDEYRDNFEQNINEDQMILSLDTTLYVRQLDVWKTINATTGSNNETFTGLAGLNPDTLTDTTSLVPGQIELGQFKRLTEGTDYEYDYQRGYFWLKSQPTTNEIIAIAYQINSRTVGQLWQEIDSTATATDTIKLKLIKPQASNPTYTTAWSYSMRNVYNLGASGLSTEGFDARVIYYVTGEDQEVDQAEGKTYNYLMGLDRLNDQGDIVVGGDKKIDLSQRFIFDLANGYVIFPSRTPFAPQEDKFHFDEERHVNIYQTNDRTLEQQESKFEIEVKTTSVSSTFDLGFNVLEGSEKVTLNGRQLTRDRDYTIDYFSGTLDITAPEARRADAQVDIDYERGALFQLDKKSLLGGRLEYQFGEQNFIGMTGLYYSKSTLDQRVRIGQEPIKNFIWDVNTSLNFSPNFLTKLFDLLPIVETSAESKLKIEAEYAQVNPNPNTFNEPSIGDNDGVAYIDDFEGSKRFTSLGIQYRIWTAASAPIRFRLLSKPEIDYGAGGSLDNYLRAMDRTRVKFNWFNPFDQIPTQTIWPDRDVTAQSGTTTTVLTLRWLNNSVNVDSAWAGIMRSTISFPDQKKTKFIEIWVRGKKGQVNIDLGRISEDWYVRGGFPNPNVPGTTIPSLGSLNTEDGNFNGLLDVDLGEDTGIDGVDGQDGTNPNDAGDDDWADPRSTAPEFDRINGTEGNAQAQGARFPDTEDLDGDGSLNKFNDYFEYNFDLADPSSPYLVSQTFFNDGSPTGWKLYRIPIKDYDFKVGNPDTTFQQIFFARLWLNNIPQAQDDYDTLQIATFDFVGNEWEEDGIDLTGDGTFERDDDKFSITVYNTDEHGGPPANYVSPPGVEGVKDRITQAVSKEQSLVMELKDLPRGSRVQARKQLREKLNLINYKKMKMFVHGDKTMLPQDSLVFYIRFGPTEKVYYEYREKIYPDWSENNTIEIDFAELATTKDSTISDTTSLNGSKVFYRRDPNFPNKEFYVVGNPGLHNINYMVIGAVNRGDRDLVDKEIWVDELRVTGVDRQSGSAMRLLTDLSIADIATVRAQWELIDDNFRRLEQQFASDNGKDMTRERQSYFLSLRLNKFMPEGLGLEIPIDAKYTRSQDVPKYFYNSDRPTGYQFNNIEDRMKAFFGLSGEPEGLEDEIYYSETRSIGGTLRRRDRPRDPLLLRLTVNQLVFDMDYSDKYGHTPTDEYDSTQTVSGQVSYKIPFGKDNFIKPFGFLGKSWFLKPLASQKIYYLPSAASANFALTDNYSVRKNRLEIENPLPNVTVKTTEKFALGYKLTESINFDYTRDYQHDPRLEAKDSMDAAGKVVKVVYKQKEDVRAIDAMNSIISEGDFGVVRRISQRFGANWTPTITSWFSPNFRYGSNFIYSLDRPQINAKSSNLNVNKSFGFDFKLATLVEKIYKPKPKSPGSTGGGRGGQGGRRGSTGGTEGEGSGESEGKDGEKKAKAQLPIPLNPALWVWYVLDAFKTFTLDFKFDDAYAHANLTEVPGWKYQFGFASDPYRRDSTDVAIRDTTYNKQLVAPNIRNTRGVNGDMQVDIIKNLKTSLKYNLQEITSESNEQKTRTVSNSVFFLGDDPGKEQDTTSTDWWKLIPDWRLSLSGVEKLPLFKLFARTASLEHARSGKFTKSDRLQGIDANGKEIWSKEQWSYSNNYQPFIGLTVNTVWGITASLRSNSSITYDYRSAGATTKREQSGINFTASYSVTKGFRLPIPFLRKKELKNEIQFSLAFDKTDSKNYSRSATDTEFQELDVSSNWKLRPSITYRFSQKVNGTAFYEQSKATNKRTGTTTYKEFGINVNIAIR